MGKVHFDFIEDSLGYLAQLKEEMTGVIREIVASNQRYEEIIKCLDVMNQYKVLGK